MLFFGVAGVFLLIGCLAHYTTTTSNYTVTKNSGSFERGKNLAFNICGQCHYDAALHKFTGNPMYDLPWFMGKVYSANLTHATTTGILTKYTDAELAYLLKTGISRNGIYIPYMIRPNLADEDLNDILVYFHSADKAVATSDKVPGTTHLNLFGKLATAIAGKPLPYEKGIPVPKENEAITYGRYLVDNLGCYHCHSKSILSLNYSDPEKSKGYMQGGMKFNTRGKKVFASNLTPDKQTGIGNYTKEGFRKALVKGIRPSGDSLQPPMQKFKHLSAKQADAIFAYLVSLTPVTHKVKHLR